MIPEFKKLSLVEMIQKETNDCSAMIERELHENRLYALFCSISTQLLAQCVAERTRMCM